MKRLLLSLAVLLVAPLLFAAGQASGQQKAAHAVHEETRKNLDTAMHGEGFAAAKYHQFAEQARKNGHAELAQLFEDAANVERSQHFREEGELSGLVGTDAENLRDAIKGEEYESSTMYPQFAREAEARGDTAAADRFREIANDERKHHDAFQAALDQLEHKAPKNQARTAPPTR